MRTYLGLPIWFWDTPVETLLDQRKKLDQLNESDEDSFLPYFATRTLTYGIKQGTLADLAFLIAFGTTSSAPASTPTPKKPSTSPPASSSIGTTTPPSTPSPNSAASLTNSTGVLLPQTLRTNERESAKQNKHRRRLGYYERHVPRNKPTQNEIQFRVDNKCPG